MNIIKDQDRLKLSPVEILILRFIETKTSRFINMTIIELADALYVSIGAITYFVKKVGFTNYKEFKKYVIKVFKSNKKSDLFDPNDDIENINLFYIHSIEKTINLLDIASVDRVVEKIMKTDKIITMGIGSSLTAAKEMGNALNSLNLNAVVAKSTHDIALWLDEAKKEKYIVILFSKLMSSNELVVLVKLLKKHNISTVLITSNKNYVSEENFDVLLFETLEQDKRMFSVSSKIVELFVSDILLMKINSKLNLEKGDFYNEFQKVWRKKPRNERKTKNEKK